MSSANSRSGVSGIEPAPYRWDFDGACAPGVAHTHGMMTFSVGIFQWLPKTSGQGLKRGKVVKRVSGSVFDAQRIYAEARQYIAANLTEAPMRTE